MDAQVQERELDFQQVWQMFAETRAQFAETRAQIEASDVKLTRLFAETDAQVKETSKQVGALGNKWGRFVEGIVKPATVRLFQERGIAVTRTAQRVKSEERDGGMEIDILAYDTQYVVVIEVKSTLTQNDVRDHIERLARFKAFFPEHAARQVVGAVAGIVIDGEADKFACKQGLFVIVQSGETVEIANDEQFQPKLW